MAVNVDWHFFEKNARASGYSMICGVDEAGRGPLFGPVYAAAVILPPECEITGLNDSKQLTEKKRDALFDIITEQALSYGIGSASAQEIDKINILNATYLAMLRAVASMAVQPDYALIDGNRMPPELTIPGETVVKGDAKSASIAAASILAKVSRDRLLYEMDLLYPQYGLKRHKGYPTAAHYDAIKAYGVLKEHRKTFLRNLHEK